MENPLIINYILFVRLKKWNVLVMMINISSVIHRMLNQHHYQLLKNILKIKQMNNKYINNNHYIF